MNMQTLLHKINYSLQKNIIDDNQRRYLGLSRVLPDFLIVGAQKAGTTSLYHYLKQHPQVIPASQNEVHFFDYKFHKGQLLYRSYFPTLTEIQEKQKVLNKKIITGETSPSYLFNPLVAHRIAQLIPNIKIIILLRDPVARTYSHYQHEVRKGREKSTFEAVIKQEKPRLQRKVYTYQTCCRAYLARSLYIRQIKAYFQLFKKEDILIISSENFFSNVQYVYNKVLAFLEIEPFEIINKKPQNSGVYNKKNIPLKEELRDYFSLYNDELCQYLGRDFNW